MTGSCLSHQKGKGRALGEGVLKLTPTAMRQHQVDIQKDEHPRNKEQNS